MCQWRLSHRDNMMLVRQIRVWDWRRCCSEEKNAFFRLRDDQGGSSQASGTIEPVDEMLAGAYIWYELRSDQENDRQWQTMQQCIQRWYTDLPRHIVGTKANRSREGGRRRMQSKKNVSFAKIIVSDFCLILVISTYMSFIYLFYPPFKWWCLRQIKIKSKQKHRKRKTHQHMIHQVLIL